MAPKDPSNPTHYQVLGVAKNATAAQVRAAYRELARRHHPDVSRGDDATAVFARISAAYETLSDAERRREYDRSLERRSAPPTRPEDLRPHYTWTNIADGKSTVAEVDDEWFEDVYSAFFAPRAGAPGGKGASRPGKRPGAGGSGGA